MNRQDKSPKYRKTVCWWRPPSEKMSFVECVSRSLEFYWRGTLAKFSPCGPARAHVVLRMRFLVVRAPFRLCLCQVIRRGATSHVCCFKSGLTGRTANGREGGGGRGGRRRREGKGSREGSSPKEVSHVNGRFSAGRVVQGGEGGECDKVEAGEKEERETVEKVVWSEETREWEKNRK